MTVDICEPVLDKTPPCVVALGNFDGVHTAHRELLKKAVETAEELTLERGEKVIPAAFTFKLLKPNVGYITDFDEKTKLLHDSGTDVCYFCDFGKIKDMSPEEFTEKILISRVNAVGVVCGFNFRFGKNAEGDAAMLNEILSRKYGITLSVIEQIKCGGITVSSTEIRKAISGGDFGLVKTMLGREYEISGIVEHGREVGRKMDCPTLNIPVDIHRALPHYGVYFSRCLFDGKSVPSICNIGVRPTFDSSFGESRPLCEIHLLRGSDRMPKAGDRISVIPDRFCRPEIKFDSPSALYRQIEKDTADAVSFYALR